jgi:eukaryotic-like serine/threonine-protein kinase
MGEACYAPLTMPESLPSDAAEPIVNSCPTCGQLIDVTALEPYSKIICESCQDTIRVRTHFHHFQIREQIGIGGMSRVFRATDTALKRDVALKILNRQCSDDAHRVEQFEREARITASISHPNVVKVYSSGWDQGYFYIAMELVRGGSLDDMIRKQKRVHESRVLEIAVQTAHGLKAAQRAGLIHRDIKPGNILFADDGTAKIVDFGLALMVQSPEMAEKELWATPYYVPPEKLNGGTEDHRSDIYSLGASLYHAVLGKPPCATDSNSLEELRALKSQTVNLSDEDAMLVSQETTNLLECTLQKDPADRYETYDDFIKHAEFALQHPSKGLPRSRTKKTFTRPQAIAALLTAVALGGIIAYVAKPKPNTSPGEPGLQIVSDPTVSENATISEQFIAARNMLSRGELPEAKSAFEDLADSAPQPTANWALFNAGLCALLQGQEESSRGLFARLTNPSDDSLGKFFQQMNELMSSTKAVTKDAVKFITPDSYASIGWLVCGLKNWQLGEWRQAMPLLQQFADANPTGSSAWVQNYQDLIKPHLSDIALLKGWPKLQATEITGKEGLQRLEQATAVVAKLHLQGITKQSLEKEITDFKEKLQPLLEQEKAALAQMELELQTKEKAAYKTAVEEASRIAAGTNFQAAIARLKQDQFQSASLRESVADQIVLWQQADDFLTGIAKDFPLNVADTEITRVDGVMQKGRVLSANREGIQLQVGTLNGEVAIPWSQIQPTQLIRLAESVLEADRITDSDEYYRRREAIVAFALKSNLPSLGSLRGNQLAQEHRGFRARWKRLQEQTN